MYAQIETKAIKGIFKVLEICGGIVCVELNGRPYDTYLKNGELLRFTDENGLNFIKNHK